MGKVKKLRQKCNALLKSKTKKEQPLLINTKFKAKKTNVVGSKLRKNLISAKTFAVNSLINKTNTATENLQSVKCAKQLILPKKDKLKLRRGMLMKKIDTVKKKEKDLKTIEKRKKTPIIGDTHPLLDALPSLESLYKNKKPGKSTTTINTPVESKKNKAIEKAAKRKKELVLGVKALKSAFKNKNLQKNSLEKISQHIKTVISSQK